MAIVKHPRVLASEDTLLSIIAAEAHVLAAGGSLRQRIEYRVGVYMPEPRESPSPVFVWDAWRDDAWRASALAALGPPGLFTALTHLPPSSLRTEWLEPAPVAVEEPAPVAVEEPAPVAVEEPAPVAVEEPAPVAVEEPAPRRFYLPSPEILAAACRDPERHSGTAFPIVATLYEFLRFTPRGDDIFVDPEPILRVNKNVLAPRESIAAAVREVPALPHRFFVGEDLMCDRRGFRFVVWPKSEGAPEVERLDEPARRIDPTEMEVAPTPHVPGRIEAAAAKVRDAMGAITKRLDAALGTKPPAPMQVQFRSPIARLGGVAMNTRIDEYEVVIAPGVTTSRESLRRALAFRRADQMVDAEFPFSFRHGENLVAAQYGPAIDCVVSVVLESQIPDPEERESTPEVTAS